MGLWSGKCCCDLGLRFLSASFARSSIVTGSRCLSTSLNCLHPGFPRFRMSLLGSSQSGWICFPAQIRTLRSKWVPFWKWRLNFPSSKWSIPSFWAWWYERCLEWFQFCWGCYGYFFQWEFSVKKSIFNFVSETWRHFWVFFSFKVFSWFVQGPLNFPWQTDHDESNFPSFLFWFCESHTCSTGVK